VQSAAGASQNDASRWHHKGSGETRFIDARPVDTGGEPRTTFGMGESVVLEFDMEVSRAMPSHHMAVVIKRAETRLSVLHLLDQDEGFTLEQLAIGKHRVSVELPSCMLYPGTYTVTPVVHFSGKILDRVEDALTFSMVQQGGLRRTVPFRPHLGVFHSPSIWRVL
jgi:hypothetical protein